MPNWDLLVENYYKNHRRWNSARIDRLILEVLSEEDGSNPDEAVLRAIRDYVQANGGTAEEVSIVDSKGFKKIMVPAHFRKDAKIYDVLKGALEGEFPSGTMVPSKVGSGEGFTVKQGRSKLAKYVFKPSGRVSINKGDIAEGILGAAIFAKFVNPDVKVTDAVVHSVLKDLDAQPDAMADNDRKVDKKIQATRGEDTVTLRVALAVANYNGLIDPKWRGELADKYSSAIKYANGERIIDVAREELLDQQPSAIDIISDGVSDQKGTKIDVKVLIDGKPTRLGSVSLKAGSSTMGQVGSPSWELMGGKDGFFDGMFGVMPSESLKAQWQEATSSRNKDATIAAGEQIYQDIAGQIKNMRGVKGDNPEQEADFLQKVISGIRNAATSGEKGVKIVDFRGGDYKVLDFDERLDEVMKDVDLDVVYNPSTFPRLYILDKITGKPLIKMRMKLEMQKDKKTIKNVRHYIEKEAYLSKLLDIAERLDAEEK